MIDCLILAAVAKAAGAARSVTAPHRETPRRMGRPTFSTRVFAVFVAGFCVAGLCFASWTMAAAASAAGTDSGRIALVIGNSAYQAVPRLPNPANDARGIAEVLAADGFEISGGSALIDADKSTMERAIRQFGRELKNHSVGIFYYAGHGAQIEGRNYLFPVSAKLDDKDDAKWELVDVSDILDEMQHANNRLNVLILDACRNNPFGDRGMRGASGGLAMMDAARGTFISYAAAPGQTAADGGGEHSPYTLALMKTLRKPGLNLDQVFNNVANSVFEQTLQKQEPWIAKSPINGDFYFLEVTTGALELTVSPPEAVLWLDGKEMGKADGFQRQIPEGTHEIDIRAEGYEGRHDTVTIQANREKSMGIALASAAAPPVQPAPRTTGTLVLDVAANNAMAILDGKPMGPAKGFRQEVSAGNHVIEISAEGYETQRSAVAVDAGSEKIMVVALSQVGRAPPPPPTTGTLELEVPTPGANLQLDGKPMGLASGFRRELPAGDHVIEINAAGYATNKQTVAIGAGVEKNLVLSLVPLPNPAAPPAGPSPAGPSPEPAKKTAWLVVTVEPETATVAVDGAASRAVGSIRQEVPPGDHVIKVTGAGLSTQQLTVQVNAGETLRVPLKLVPNVPSQPRAVSRPRIVPDQPSVAQDPGYRARPAEVAHSVPPPAAPNPPPPAVGASSAPRPGAKCFTFGGKQYCE